MQKIKQIEARQIIDSRGNPTIETTVILESGLAACASVPSGASTGSHEAVELRDGDNNNFAGKGVLKAISNIKTIIEPNLRGTDVSDQLKIDTLMLQLDGTENKSRLGANSILSVSMAAARASAHSLNQPLYKHIKELYKGSVRTKEVSPLFNVINGGLHAEGSVSFQEFFIIPKGKNFEHSLQMGCEIYQKLKKQLHFMGKNTNLGDEGGFAPHFENNDEVLSLLFQVSKKYNVGFGLDVASNTFFENGNYSPEKIKLTSGDYIEFISKICKKHNLEILEDPLAEDAWDDWVKLTSKVGSNLRIIGDDLLVTNPKRLKKAIATKAGNGILVKVNQIGTLSETLEVVKIAQNADFTVIISHRSGETTDDFIADLAVGVGADYVKFGAPARGERVAKYNRLLEIYSQKSL